MIAVTKLNGEEIIINAEMIELVEKTPDTIISLTTGHKYMVRDTVEQVVKRVIEYKRSIMRFDPQAIEERLRGGAR